MRKPLLLPRERKLLLAALVVVSTSVVVSRLALPFWERLALLQQQASVSGKKMARLRELITRKPVIEQKAKAYARFWSTESDELLQGTFLDDLEQLARAGNLQISVKPRPIQRNGTVSRFGVELEVDATQPALLGFLDQLFTRPDLIEVSRLKIFTTVSKEYPLRAILLLTKVVLHQEPH